MGARSGDTGASAAGRPRPEARAVSAWPARLSGYAQQTEAPHVLSPQRSTYIAAVGLRTELQAADAQARAITEKEIYTELARRFQDAGVGWRNEELPWTPSFLPFLLKRVDPLREGLDVLLRRAKDLRDSKAVKRYRRLRDAPTSAGAAEAAKIRKTLGQGSG